jgi:hypothetical protein
VEAVRGWRKRANYSRIDVDQKGDRRKKSFLEEKEMEELSRVVANKKEAKCS